MSTLLDLKSSVLRQVQRSQSLRGRREPSPAPSPTIPSPLATLCSDTTGHRVAEGSEEFFERMSGILQKQERMLHAGQSERESCLAPPPPEHAGQVPAPDRATRKELDLLYEEAIYTVVNRVGVPSPEYVTNEWDIFTYLQKAFDMGQEEHDIILQRVQESQRASFSLRVSVMKGKNLMAKDANGYSDPYCMLGLLLGQSPRETEEKKERKFSFRKRREKLEKRGSVREVLAAQSIQEIPVVGYDKWFKLEPRSSASKVQGECHLILRLFSSQRDTTLSKRESNVNIHKKILSQILEYEHSHIQVEPYNWNGQVSPPAWTVLSHHAAQADLSPLQQAIIRWQCYSSHHRSQRMCYSLLLRLLRTIDAEWDSAAVHGELGSHLADSFGSYIEYCLGLIKNMRQVFPCSNSAAVIRCELMLRGVGHLQSMQAFRTMCPLRSQLHLEIATVIKKGTVEWYEATIAHFKPDEGSLEEQLRRLVLVVDAVCSDVQRGHSVFNKLFHSTVKVEFFSISYRQLEKLVADDVCVAMERVCGTLEQESSRLTQAMGETLFELYMSLKTLKRFREFLPLRDTKMLALTGFHNWFKSSIHKWLNIVHERSCDRIRRAVEMDQLDRVEQQVKHSSSAMDVIAYFCQVRELWAQLAWPDSSGAFIFITRLTDNFCSEAVCYSELIKRKVERSQLGRDHKSLTVQMCTALNDIEHVRLYLGNLPREMDWRGVEQAMEESCGPEGKEQVNKSLNGQLYNADLDLLREAKRLITVLTDKMLSELKRYIQHISLSPDSINNDEAVSPLMKYLDNTLVILSESLVKENLSRVLQSLWEVVLRMIQDTVAENRGVQAEFYTRFQYTVEALVQFFHAEGEGLALENLKSGDYKVLEEELRLNKCSSFELIEQYFLEKISQQRILKHSKFGRVSVKCYYDAPEQRLTVEILHAADLIALDANGLSDPFVIVELCPHHLFPMAKSQRTQVKLKTLHPVFDEFFYFHVSPEQYRHRCACLTFTVMDYDWLSTNDFAGEAVAPLSDFCWPGRPNATPAGKTVQPFILHLSRQKPSEKPIMKMLEARTGEREAQEFVRRLKEIEKSMEEE
ncbi:BAI1-associated protein 3 isoform X2 [Denticeps clupeoides]|uniref:BAI1-associated protein 3 isoform X2 n=1 Tax=Denticeps clupeoides TaxID=299321 RepID=UPI0010A30825|nr:BAI1-associated protein 3 isoform X2 [Denticeps clupeoides]